MMAPSAAVHNSAATGPRKSVSQGKAVHSHAQSSANVLKKAAIGVRTINTRNHALLPGFCARSIGRHPPGFLKSAGQLAHFEAPRGTSESHWGQY